MESVVQYRAFDGKIFTTKQECEDYEIIYRAKQNVEKSRQELEDKIGYLQSICPHDNLEFKPAYYDHEPYSGGWRSPAVFKCSECNIFANDEDKKYQEKFKMLEKLYREREKHNGRLKS